MADVDLDRLRQERMRMTSFNDCIQLNRASLQHLRRIPLELAPPSRAVALERPVARFPYVPSDPKTRDDRCREVYNIQVQGLAQRMDATGIQKLVLGISGGLDSTQALMVSAKAMDELGLPRSNVLAVTMPGFATTERSRALAWRLMQSFGATASEIDIRASAQQMFKDIGHPFARGESKFDVTFENVQAGERTSHLFRLANFHGALVVGTSDLSRAGAGLHDVWRRRSHVALRGQRIGAEDADPPPD